MIISYESIYNKGDEVQAPSPIMILVSATTDIFTGAATAIEFLLLWFKRNSNDFEFFHNSAN